MKKSGIAARIIAIILSVSLIVPDTVSAAGADLNDALDTDVTESVLDTETEEVFEEIAVESEDVDSTGTAGKPAKVTGLKVSGKYLTWDSQDMTAYGYDIMATNPSGVKYYSFDALNADGKWVYGYDSATSHDFYNTHDSESFYITSSQLDTSAVGAADYVSPGVAYRYQVRAVNRVSVKDSLGNTTYTYAYGPWSNAVSFTMPAYVKLTNVKVDMEQTDEDDLYLNLGQAVNWYNLYATIYSDAACTNSVMRPSLYITNSANTKAKLSYSGLTPGQTYYVRLYNSVYEYDDAEPALAGGVTYSNVVSFQAPGATAIVQEAAPATALSVANAEADGIYVKASSLAAMMNYQNDCYVRFEYSANNKDWYTYTTQDPRKDTDDVLVYYSELAKYAGTPNTAVYFRAQAYVWNADSGIYVQGTVSNVLTLRSPAISRITNLKYEQGRSGYTLRYSGSVNTSYETVKYEYSTNKSFTKDFNSIDKERNTKTTTEPYLSYWNLVPGKTYYVRAYVDSIYYSDADTIHGRQYSAYTNVLTLKAGVPDITAWATVTSNSVKLSMDRVVGSYGPITGYQIERKSGKSYTELVKLTDDVYTDEKLTSDTKYTYRVRAYYYDSSAKKMYYGAWAYVDATTWGDSLDLKAAAASTTSVKLSWNKVAGADGYEIYRYVGSGDSKYYYSTTGAFSKTQLVKTIKKVSAKTYTDKGLTAGEKYSYIVRAYRVKGGKTYYIDGYAEADLAFGPVVIVKRTQSTKTGKTTVTWKKNAAAKGYLIEKYDEDTGRWKTTKQIKKNSTVKYTFPAVTGTDISARYRIRAYSGKKFSDGTEIVISRHIAVAGSVKAKASAKNGAVTVSWKKVSGADYYQVYRTTSSEFALDEGTNAIINVTGEELLDFYTPDEDAYSGYTPKNYVTATSFVDKKISYINNYGEEVVLEEGPQAGVKYYYYIMAYKIVDENYKAAEAAEDEISLTKYDAVSSYGYSKAATAIVTSAKVGKAAIKSVKSSKRKQVTVAIKKKVSGAIGYQIYRSAKKNKGYTLVGTTTKLSYTDKTVKSGSKYYYKVKAVSRNEAGIDIYSAFSSASKIVKVK